MTEEQFFTKEELDELFLTAGLLLAYPRVVDKPNITKIHKQRLKKAAELVFEIVSDYAHRFDYQPAKSKGMN